MYGYAYSYRDSFTCILYDYVKCTLGRHTYSKKGVMCLNDLYSLPNIVRVVKSRRMRWAGHVARMGEDRGVHRVLVGRPKGKRP
jgi:hypothetical protein